MHIQAAYEAGQKIRRAILEKQGDINTTVYKLQEAKKNKHDFSYAYLKLCLDYNVSNNNDFMINMLTDEVTSEDVGISLCLGIMSEETKYIDLQKAALKWGLNDSTLRKAISTGKLKEGEDCYKENRIWKIKIDAMIREYGELHE